MAKSLFFGKYCEHKIFAELLKKDFDIYLPIVDDKGVDCIIRNNNGSHIDIQIKGRQPRWIFNFGIVKPRKNYFFILFPPDQEIYIIPSIKISEWLKGRRKLGFNNTLKKELESKYKNNFDLLNYSATY